ncbi:MAG: LytTR family transcriptional regulator DNA-binding domain-containing protein, partial [Candidatus Eisenbacteria bacterium]
RLHRSHFARIDQVRELRTEGNGDAEVTLASGVRLPVSRTYRERLVAALERAR